MTIVLALAPSGTTVWAWIDADGVTHEFLPNTGYQPQWGRAGAWMPPHELAEDALPFGAGSRLRQVRVAARTVTFPLLVTGSTESQLRDRFRNLLRMVDPTKGDGYLVCTRDDSVRQLACRYLEGLEMEETAESYNLTSGAPFAQTQPTFRVLDPYWTDTEDSVVSATLDDVPVTWFGREWFSGGQWFGASNVYRTFSVNNDGDAEAWPVWTITGPGTDVVLRNLTTGKRLASSYPIPTGGRLVIDTRPAENNVTDGFGSNLFGELSSDSELWPLAQGFNTVQIDLGGSLDGSVVELEFARRWFGP